LVDDDREILDAVQYAMENEDYEVHIARDGNQGIAMAEHVKPDLMIVDMMMPKRSGFLVLERLSQTYDRPLRAIMVTANEGDRHRAYAKLLGASEYIIKPFAMELLLETARRILKEPLSDMST
jgi:DNA-binding response OmpR family regulator